MHWKRWLAAAAPFVLASATAAQSAHDVSSAAAHFAITTTTVGTSSPNAAALLSRASGWRVRVQGAYASEGAEEAHRTLLIGLAIPDGQGAFSIEGGVIDHVCPDQIDPTRFITSCGGLRTLGVRWMGRLLGSRVGDGNEAEFRAAIELALGTSFGTYAEASDGGAIGRLEARNYAASAVLPFSVSPPPGRRVSIVPVIAPGAAFGLTKLELEAGPQSDRTNEGGVRAMLGGGVALVFGGTGITVDVGARKLFADDARLVVGAGASIPLR